MDHTLGAGPTQAIRRLGKGAVNSLGPDEDGSGRSECMADISRSPGNDTTVRVRVVCADGAARAITLSEVR